MQVISVSRRTDIPAFYNAWFMNRVRAGYCHWRNPFSGQVYHVSLAPADVLAIVFWTRWPRALLRSADELEARGYPFYCQVTITGFGPPLETHNPPPDAAIAAFRHLSERLGPARVTWRYDPIILGGSLTPDAHVARFARMAAQLAGATDRVVYSFVDWYGKTARNLAAVTRDSGMTFEQPGDDQRIALVERLRDAAARHGMQLQGCCEGEAGRVAGVLPGACIDRERVYRVAGREDVPLRAGPTREHCGCIKATDIGAYESCLFGCRYCYATSQRAAARDNYAAHDPEDSILYRPSSLRGADLDALAGPPEPRESVRQPRLI